MARTTKGQCTSAPARLGFRLFDPLPRFRPARSTPAAVPRISVPGFSRPFAIAVRPPPSPDDPVDAARLALRLAALGEVLDDLPRQAKRFALWRARLKTMPDAVSSTSRLGRKRRTTRIWPLRPGPPPGRRQAGDELRTVLENTHGFALWALQPPDSS